MTDNPFLKPATHAESQQIIALMSDVAGLASIAMNSAIRPASSDVVAVKAIAIGFGHALSEYAQIVARATTDLSGPHAFDLLVALINAYGHGNLALLARNPEIPA